MALRYSFLTLGSFALTGLVIGNAFFQKQQFYPSVVYLTKSNPSLAVLYVQAFVFVLLLGKIVQKLFFGQLRAAESEHLMEKAWYAITETCLAFTVFRDDFSPKFVAQFTLLLFLKCFHWLSEDRVDYMERSPVITLLFHVRMMSIVAVLSALDSYYVSHAYFTTLLKGASVQIVFGFEYAILLTIVFHIAIKYILHSIDLRNAQPWEGKAVYLLYTELVIGFLRVLLYSAFVVVMMRLHTFPLFSIRPMYLTLRAFKKAVSDALLSRRAIEYMNTLYPDASEDELRRDNVCIICREEMLAGGAKKLPCNHIFHAACLRSWFQRQQTCPTCRLEILRMTPGTGGGQQRRQQQAPQVAGAAAAAAQQQQQQAPAPGFTPQAQAGANQQNRGFPPFPQFPIMPPGLFGAMNVPPQQQQQPQAGAANTTGNPAGGDPPFDPLGTPPFPFFPPSPPFMLPFPMAPNFSGLSDEEVRRMEGNERSAVEARIQCLRNIQTLLDAAVVQLQQYTSILTALSSSPQFREQFTSQPPPAETSSSRTAEEQVARSATSASKSGNASNGGLLVDEPAAAAEMTNPGSSGTAGAEDGPSTSTTSLEDDVRLRRLLHFAEKNNKEGSNSGNEN